MRLRRHVVGEQWRAIGGAHAGDIGEVLDRDRQAREPARFALGFAGLADHDASGMSAGAVETKRGQRVHRRLDLGDTFGRSFDEVERRDLALLQERHRLDRRQLPQIVVHGALMSNAPGKDTLRIDTAAPCEKQHAEQHEVQEVEGQRRLEDSVASKMAPPSQPPTAMPAMANSMTTPSRQPAMEGP